MKRSELETLYADKVREHLAEEDHGDLVDELIGRYTQKDWKEWRRLFIEQDRIAASLTADLKEHVASQEKK